MKCLIFSIAILLQVYPSLIHLLTASNFLVILLNSFSVLEPQEGIVAIGSGGNFALSAARALKRKSNLPAREIAKEALQVAAELCIYTNDTLNIAEIKI